MYEDGLYDSLVYFLTLILDDNRLLSGPVGSPPFLPSLPSTLSFSQTISHQDLQVFLIFADALLHTKDYVGAESVLSKLLALKTSGTHPHLFVTPSSTPSRSGRRNQQSANQPIPFNELEVRHQLHTCKINLRKYEEALVVLTDVPRELRTPKINHSLGQLYTHLSLREEAAKSFIDVLKGDPLALDVIQTLFELSPKPNEMAQQIVSTIGPILSGTPEHDWMLQLVEIGASLHSFKTERTVELVKKFLTHSLFKDNRQMQITLGQAYYYNGDYRKAISVFKPLFSKDLKHVRGLNWYASCLAIEGDVKGLEQLATRVIPRVDREDVWSEPWVVLGYYTLLTNKKDTKAQIFANKASLPNQSITNYVEGLLLKGKIYLEQKGAREAIPIFKAAHDAQSHRWEAVEGLTNAYLAENNKQEGKEWASEALKSFGQTPRALTLHAVSLLADAEKTRETPRTAKLRLESAVSKDHSFLPAVYLLAKLYMEEQQHKKAIDLLTKTLEVERRENTQKIHRLLAECYAGTGDTLSSLHHQSIAKKMEVSYRSAGEAAQSLNTAAPTSSTGSGGATTPAAGAAGVGRGGAGQPPEVIDVYQLEDSFLPHNDSDDDIVADPSDPWPDSSPGESEDI